MGIKLAQHRCDDCQGMLDFDKINKRFFCPYCGKTYDKDTRVEKVQIDGVAGVRENVRAVLFDVSKYDFASAEKNISECEKLDYNFVGTNIANICYYIIRASIDKENRNNLLGKAKYYIEDLKKDYPSISEEETLLYDFFDNPDIYAIIYISFLKANLIERAEHVANYLDTKKIFNSQTNKLLLSILLKMEIYDEAKVVALNTEYIDKKYTLYEILKYYPYNDDKKMLVNKLFSLKAFTYKDNGLVDKYLADVPDNNEIKLIVLTESLKLNMDINVSSALKSIFSSQMSEESIVNAFATLSSVKLAYDDVLVILDYCINENCPSKEVCISGMKSLKDSKSLYEINSKQVINMFVKTRFLVEEKIEVFDFILNNFQITTKQIDEISEFILLKFEESYENRETVISMIIKHIKNFTITTLESYFIYCKLDGENKVNIIKKILDMNYPESYICGILDKYLKNSKEDKKIKFSIISELLNRNYNLSEFSVSYIILNADLDEELINVMLSKKLNFSTNLANEYLLNLSDMSKFNSFLFSKIIATQQDISARTVEQYILKVKDKSIKKSETAIRLISQLHTNLSNTYNVSFDGDSIVANLMQCYLFVSNDEQSDKINIIRALENNGIKLKDAMVVNKQKVPFKKYIVSKNNLRDDIKEICTELGVYKLFF